MERDTCRVILLSKFSKFLSTCIRNIIINRNKCKMFYKMIIKQVHNFVHFNTNIFVKTCRTLYANNSVEKNIPLLQDRFIDFFRKEARYNLYVVHESEKEVCVIKNSSSDNGHLEQTINNIPTTKLPLFLHSLGPKRHALVSHDFSHILSVIDDICSKKLRHMEKESVLKCLHEWHNICQGNTMTTKLYQEFIHAASVWLTKRNNSLEFLVYVMFYIGLSKKLEISRYIMKKCLNEIYMYGNLLSVDELCIICSSSFKCSVPIKSADLLHYICNAVELNFETLVSDPAYIVTFMKGLRLAKCHNFNIMNKLASNKYSNEIFNMTFTAKVHILAIFAEALYDKKHFITSLIQSCIQDCHPAPTMSPYYSTLRLKDISRFLWAANYLGYRLQHREVKKMIEVLQKCVAENHHLKVPEHILVSLLSLWSMGLKEPKLFKEAITEDFMRILKEKYPFRIQTRLSLLLTCIQIEAPTLLCKEHFEWTTKNIIPQEALKKHFRRRNFLKQIFKAVTNLGHHMKLHAVCDCYIPNLNILGVTVTSLQGKILHIEVLDETVCLHQTCTPHGLMKLKLLLLKNLGHQVVVIRENQFDAEQNTSEIYEFLEEKLAKIL